MLRGDLGGETVLPGGSLDLLIPIARGSDATKPDGLYVSEVVPGGAAAKAGLRHADIITELNGRRVTGADQLQAITLTQGPGSKLEVEFERDGQTRTTTLTLQG